jgi:glycosyltransferase involved in cell wall biosynthesis
MRIAFFGNTNNYPLMLAAALRRLGHDAVLVVNRPELLHRPESKYPEWKDAYPDWILDCSHLPEAEFAALSPAIEPVLDFLTVGSHALIVNDLGASLLDLCGDIPTVALLTGSDVTYYANPESVEVRLRGTSQDFRASARGRLTDRRAQEFVERQRNGIRRARVVSAPWPGLAPSLDAVLADIGVDPARRTFVFMADVERTAAHAPSNNREATRLRIVNGARLNWKKPLPPGFSSMDHKGTDILLEGFAQFRAAGGDADLVLFRKGLHIAETEQLADTLGVSDRIIWREEASHETFWREIVDADIVCDQFGDSFPAMVALDAMALARPVVANFPEAMSARFPVPIPACHASTSSDVAAHFIALAGSEATRRHIGAAAQRFTHEYLSPTAAAVHLLAYPGVLSAAQRERVQIAARLRVVAERADSATITTDDALAHSGVADAWRAITLRPEDMRKEHGHGWTWRLPPNVPPGDRSGDHRSLTLLLENLCPLGPVHSLHDAIRSHGCGRYSHWEERLYFSTSDNSDPRTNDRIYTAIARTAS